MRLPTYIVSVSQNKCSTLRNTTVIGTVEIVRIKPINNIFAH